MNCSGASRAPDKYRKTGERGGRFRELGPRFLYDRALRQIAFSSSVTAPFLLEVVVGMG
jgi:hypothetical protein